MSKLSTHSTRQTYVQKNTHQQTWSVQSPGQALAMGNSNSRCYSLPPTPHTTQTRRASGERDPLLCVCARAHPVPQAMSVHRRAPRTAGRGLVYGPAAAAAPRSWQPGCTASSRPSRQLGRKATFERFQYSSPLRHCSSSKSSVCAVQVRLVD